MKKVLSDFVNLLKHEEKRGDELDGKNTDTYMPNQFTASWPFVMLKPWLIYTHTKHANIVTSLPSDLRLSDRLAGLLVMVTCGQSCGPGFRFLCLHLLPACCGLGLRLSLCSGLLSLHPCERSDAAGLLLTSRHEDKGEDAPLLKQSSFDCEEMDSVCLLIGSRVCYKRGETAPRALYSYLSGFVGPALESWRPRFCHVSWPCF